MGRLLKSPAQAHQSRCYIKLVLLFVCLSKLRCSFNISPGGLRMIERNLNHACPLLSDLPAINTTCHILLRIIYNDSNELRIDKRQNLFRQICSHGKMQPAQANRQEAIQKGQNLRRFSGSIPQNARDFGPSGQPLKLGNPRKLRPEANFADSISIIFSKQTSN